MAVYLVFLLLECVTECVLYELVCVCYAPTRQTHPPPLPPINFKLNLTHSTNKTKLTHYYFFFRSGPARPFPARASTTLTATPPPPTAKELCQASCEAAVGESSPAEMGAAAVGWVGVGLGGAAAAGGRRWCPKTAACFETRTRTASATSEFAIIFLYLLVLLE
jgi:hypothetical protein